MSAKRLLTADEMAEELAVSKRTVMTWLAEGRVPAAVREAQTLRFDAEAVRKALAKRAAKRTEQLKPQGPAIPEGMVMTY